LNLLLEMRELRVIQEDLCFILVIELIFCLVSLNFSQSVQMYRPIRPSSSEFIQLRGYSYHVRVWGDSKNNQSSKPLVLLHGWMDVGASFQFFVDALQQDRLILAPDWRGFGLTKSLSGEDEQTDHFVFADYLADLDFLMDHYFANQSVDFLGHSMGANVCMLYAGIRPERIAKLINLEGFGMAKTRPAQAPNRYVKWFDELKKFHQGEMRLNDYESSSAVADRLKKTNPRISNDKAEWLATQWARADARGRWQILGSAAHKLTSANLYREDECREIHKRITAPVLCITGEEDSLKKYWGESYKKDEFYERMSVIECITHQQLSNAGHMLHHDQPTELAHLVESFLSETNR